MNLMILFLKSVFFENEFVRSNPYEGAMAVACDNLLTTAGNEWLS